MVTRDHRIEFRVYWEWHCNPGALHLVVNNVLYGGRSLWIDTSQRIWHCTNIFSCFTTQPWKYYGRDTTFTSTLALCSILTLLTLIGYDYWLFCCKKKLTWDPLQCWDTCVSRTSCPLSSVTSAPLSSGIARIRPSCPLDTYHTYWYESVRIVLGRILR